MKSEKKEISADADNFKDSHLKKGNQSPKNKDEDKTNSFSHPFKTQLRIISILLIILSIFIILTIVSYSRLDIAASSITLNDLLGIIKKDPEILARQSITQNWLGLLGAYISNILINGTFGYAVIILPLLLIYFSIKLYQKLAISPRLISNISFGLLMTLLISGFLGVLSKFTWIGNIPFEWYGKVGYFLAAIVNKIFGITTSLILFIAVIFLSIFYKLNFKFSTIISNISNGIKETFKREPKPDIDIPQIIKNENHTEAQNKVNNNSNNNTNRDTPKPQSPPIVRESPKFIEPKPAATNQPKKEDLKILIKHPEDETPKTQPTGNYIPKIQPIDFTKITVSNPQIQKEIAKENNLSDNEKNEDIIKANSISEPIPPKENDINVLQNSNEQVEEQMPETRILPTTQTEPMKQNIDLEKTISQIVQEKISKANPIPDPPKPEPPEPSKPPISISMNQIKENKSTSELHSLIYSDYWDERIDYKFPSLELLNPPSTKNVISSEELEMNARILREKLETFKIVIDNITITPGPVVTQYEFVPAPGIKISRIESLADDLAMALKAKGIRIIAPIPSKGTVGVEIPNSKPSIVRFSEVVSSEKFQKSTAKLPIALGKT
ncbi:MAG TPA: DNA translocase FtsK 4TM domain-containing protein, partial [Bacteroidota bacterium]|nr:DNA translocase FtsK 4TM domain-containing protein [Bacteroidota bacterium]